MIDLNKDEYNASEMAAIFNGGEAGVAENVTVALTKKKADDKEKAPEYKITFTDESGAECATPFWYITEATQYQTVEQQQVRQGKVLKHLIHTICGPNQNIPTFNNEKEMLDGAMKLIRDGLKNFGKARVFANYGTKEHRKKFIQPRSWVPFMEAMSVPLEETQLKVSDIDGMERLTEDKPAVPAGGGSSASADDDWD
jgi:hypothetical protein